MSSSHDQSGCKVATIDAAALRQVNAYTSQALLKTTIWGLSLDGGFLVDRHTRGLSKRTVRNPPNPPLLGELPGRRDDRAEDAHRCRRAAKSFDPGMSQTALWTERLVVYLSSQSLPCASRVGVGNVKGTL